MESERYLRTLVEGRLRRIGEHARGGHEESTGDAIHEVQTAAAALVSVGALPAMMGESIVRGMRDALVEAGRLPQDGSIVGPLGDQTPAGPVRWGDLAAAPPPSRLVRVLPIARGIEEQGVWILAAAIFVDHFVVFSCMQPPKAGEQREPRWAWTVTDDTSTVYRMQSGGSGGGSHGIWLEQVDLAPSPPPEASMLILQLRRVGDPRRPEEPDSMWRQEGPIGEELHRFEIPLNS